MPAQPPANPRRRRASLAAVARRMAGTPAGGGPRIIGQSQQPTTRGGPRVTSQTAQPTTGYGAIQPRAQAMAERIASQRSSSMQQRKAPPRTLGHATHQSEVFTGRTDENPNTPRTAFGRPMQPGGRAGKKFKIGFTPEGRIVHLYGADVAPGERRVVLPQRDTGLKLMSAAQRRARRRA